MIRAAIIGAGTAGMVIHAPCLASNPDVKLVAIVDPIEERAKSLARKFSVEHAYVDVQEMLDEEQPEIVHVASPQLLHHDHAISAMNEGANVLCEKPMANSLEECDEMIRTAKKKNVKLMIGFMKRWNIGLEKVKEIIDSKEVGQPFFSYVHHTLSASAIYHQLKQLPPNSEENSGGGIAIGLIHYVDVFRWLMGDVKFVFGIMADIFPKLTSRESFASISVDFFNGASATILLGAGPTYNFEQIEEGGIFCTRGNISFRIPGYLSYSAPHIEIQQTNEIWRQIPLKADLMNFSNWHFKREIDYWINCVKNDKHPSPSGEDGRKAQEVIYASYQSWYSGKRVKLPLKKTPSLRPIFDKLRMESHFT